MLWRHGSSEGLAEEERGALAAFAHEGPCTSGPRCRCTQSSLLSSALPRTERGLDTLRPRSRGDHGSRHGASHARQHSTKLPCAGTWRSGSPRPPSASQGPWARRGGCWRHQLDLGLQPPSHPGLPSLPLPSAAPLSRVVLVSGWGGGWPAPAGSLCCGCLDPDPGSRLPRLAQLHPGCPGRAPEGTFHLPGFVVCSAVWCRAWGGRPSGPWGPRNLLAQGRQPTLLRGSQCGLCPPCPGTCVS